MATYVPGILEIDMFNSGNLLSGQNPIEGFSSVAFAIEDNEIIIGLNDANSYQDMVNLINSELNNLGYFDVQAYLGSEKVAIVSIPLTINGVNYSPGDIAGTYYPIVVESAYYDLTEGFISITSDAYDFDISSMMTTQPSMVIEDTIDSKNGDSKDSSTNGGWQIFEGNTSSIDYINYSGYSVNDVVISGMGDDPTSVDEYWYVDYYYSESNSTESQLVFDSLYDIDRLVFDDYNIALDLDVENSAGMAISILHTAFDYIPDAQTTGYWISQADNLNASSNSRSEETIIELANQVINYYAPNGIDNASLTNLLYYRLFDTNPSTETINYFSALLDSGHLTQAELVATSAKINASQEQFIEAVTQGVVYSDYSDELFV